LKLLQTYNSKGVAIAYIDYAKAFDVVIHS